jgi:hypothetical protein
VRIGRNNPSPEDGNVVTLNLTPPRALQILRKIAQDSSRVFFTVHAEKQMGKRRITRIQVLRCLLHGHLVEGPARGIKGNWELSVEVFSAGEPITVVAALDHDERGNLIIVISTYKRHA